MRWQAVVWACVVALSRTSWFREREVLPEPLSREREENELRKRRKAQRNKLKTRRKAETKIVAVNGVYPSIHLW